MGNILNFTKPLLKIISSNEILLKQPGIEVDKAVAYNRTPLLATTSWEAMKLLIDSGADVNSKDRFGNDIVSISAHDLNRIYYLMGIGCKINNPKVRDIIKKFYEMIKTELSIE